MVIVGPPSGPLRRRLFGWSETTVSDGTEALVVEVHARNGHHPSLVRRLAGRTLL